MMFSYKELKKIARQVLAKENIFGYKSTAANQLYLLYCFSGKIYFDDAKIHKQVKYFWYSLISFQLLCSWIVGGIYLWFDDKHDLLLMLNVVNAVGASHLFIFVFPLITYYCSDRIEAMIEHVDNNVCDSSDFKQEKIFADAKKYLTFYSIACVTSASLYLFVSLIDVVLFFEQDKVKSYLYYAVPPPLVQDYRGLGPFLAATGFATVMYVFFALELYSTLGLILYWNIISGIEMYSIEDDLHAATYHLNTYSQAEVQLPRGEWIRAFERTFQHAISRFQNTIRLINYLKVFAEIIFTQLIAGGFSYSVSLLYIACTQNDMPMTLKIRSVAGFMLSAMGVFLSYWMGQHLENSVSAVSLAVYSTPWYWSVKIRKTAYIFLCQTQSLKNISIFKVYGLAMNNFSRYLHGVISYTNILRRLTIERI